MRETQAIIERVRRISAQIQQLDLSVDSSLNQLQAGQTLYARLLENTGWNPYLREQWIPVAVRAGQMIIELTGGTYAPGQVVSILAPLGHPVPLRPHLTHLLMIAEDTMPTPLIWLARTLIARGVAVTLVLGGLALEYPLELLPPEVEILRGDSDWKWPDQIDTLSWADQVIALAPSYAQMTAYEGLYYTIAQVHQRNIPDGYILGLFYQRLACGAGACQACQIATHHGDRLICADGPAFDLKEIIFR